ncbi:MAG: hypothetical protein ACI9KN_002569 [Gammaproteobacteria bacterium]|jgi:hypothetical protein
MTRLWDEPMAVSYPALFTSEFCAEFPESYEESDGLWLNAADIDYQDGLLSFELLVLYSFR